MPAEDKFSTHSDLIRNPLTRIESVTPSDTVDLAQVCRAINVASPGVVAVITADGDDDTVFVAAGIAFQLRASRIKLTGTSATGIKALS